MTPEIFPAEVWLARRHAHEHRVDPWIAGRLARMSAGERHPVDDFLFEYYSYRPGQLRRWHPGFGVVLTGPEAEPYLAHAGYTRTPDGITATLSGAKPTRLTFFRWLRALLQAIENRPPFLGCAGLHEWAMVHRAGDEIRHPRWPLRLGSAGTAAVVESLPIRCSHFDAFRFFTPAARGLNRLQPTRETAAELEQPGCLHANMDLYKWSYKLSPLCGSELIADCFALARDIRAVDMRASPYDFSALGYAPIPVETLAGRAEFETCQRDFAARARPIRARLLALLDRLLAAA